MTAVRPDIVALLVDLNVDRSDPPAGVMYRESTGEAFSAWETHRLGEARRPELEAALAYGQTLMDFHESKLADANRMVELLIAYSDHDDGERITEIAARMSPADRAEFDALLDRAAPDGSLVMPGQTPPAPRGGTS